MLQQVEIEDIERVQKKQKHCELALKQRAHLEMVWKKQREQVNERRKQDKLDADKRLQIDKAKRRERWTTLTAENPMQVDQWEEDEQIYVVNQAIGARTTDRERSAAKAGMQDQANRRLAKLADVDVLGNLRSEKKKLQEDQKDIKARLDLDKVDKRCAAAKHKEDTRIEAHHQKLASKGHLTRSNSDFFTEKRLSPYEREMRRSQDWNRRRLERSSPPGVGNGYGTSLKDLVVPDRLRVHFLKPSRPATQSTSCPEYDPELERSSAETSQSAWRTGELAERMSSAELAEPELEA